MAGNVLPGCSPVASHTWWADALGVLPHQALLVWLQRCHLHSFPGMARHSPATIEDRLVFPSYVAKPVHCMASTYAAI